MAPVIDCHTHVIPDLPLDHPLVQRWVSQEKVEKIRREARTWLKPLSFGMHQSQPLLRHLPGPIRLLFDQVGALTPLPMLLVESTPRDLDEAMKEAGVDYAVIIAHPPLMSNEFVLEAASRNSRLLPVVNIPPGSSKPGQQLKNYADQGARMLKIHAAADGEDRSSARYTALLKAASERGLPVILHTGCIHSHLLYRDPTKGDVRYFEPWFKKYPDIRFILAHMNYHEPEVALDLAEKYPNLWVDTSWQPSETIGEAVRRIGAERVLLGTDWPFAGNNLSLGVDRVRTCVEIGMVTEAESVLILGGNAVKLLGLPDTVKVEAAEHA